MALEIVDCPDCGLPAEVVSRRDLPSTSGPVPHIRTYCVTKLHHRFFPVEMLHPPTAKADDDAG